MKKGYDVYECDCELMELLEYVHESKAVLYHIQKKSKISFTSSYRFRVILCANENIHFCYSVGIMGMFFRFFVVEKIVAAVFSVLFFLLLSNTIFHVEILGESLEHRKLIEQQLKSFQTPFLYADDAKLRAQLKQLNDKLNWYAVHQKGSKLEIHYLPRLSTEMMQFQPYDLIASKDGVIAGFEVSKGNKVVKVNQKVSKGDVLVSHILIDSRSQEKTSDVFGKVFAYTFYKSEISIKKNNLPKSVLYYECLLLSRMQLQLKEDEKIIKEIPLQFQEDGDTIRMTNYYILYEMISVVGESHE